MNDLLTITNKLKTLLSQITQSKVQDKDLALALGTTPANLASMKRRNSIPYRAILDFCVRYHINANTLLFNRPVNNTIYAKPMILRYVKKVK